jgi:hypothetical protein
MTPIKKIILAVFSLIIIGLGATHALAPSFDNNFARYLTNKTPDQEGRIEAVYNFSKCIDRNQSIEENIRNLFYPGTSGNPGCSLTTGWLLRDYLRVIVSALIFLFIVLAGVKLLMGVSGDEPKKQMMSFVYIGYWAFLVFGVIWILGYVLNIENVWWSERLVNSIQNNLFLQILTFFKVLAFFIAIIMMVITWFKMMSAMDKEDKVKAGKQGAINVIAALIFIKVIDYIYVIAQMQEFATKASSLVLDVAKILWWGLGITFVGGLLYSGYLLFFSGGDEKSFKKMQWILINIAIVSVVIFVFLLLIYEIFNEFALSS